MSSISTLGSFARSLFKILDRGDEVFRPQGHLGLGDVQAELAIDAEAAHAAEAVAVGVVELLLEEVLGLFQVGRIARPQPLVDPQQGLFVAAGGVFGQRVQEQRVLRDRP